MTNQIDNDNSTVQLSSIKYSTVPGICKLDARFKVLCKIIILIKFNRDKNIYDRDNYIYSMYLYICIYI